MLFDVKQFEHFINEKTLKKGLKLFERGELEFIERQPGFEYHFLVSAADLHLKKRGDKLLNYTCTCASNSYCEHLSAAMFYFQQEALGIAVKQKRLKKQKSAVKVGLNNEVDFQLKEFETASLLELIKESKNELPASEIKSFLIGKSTLWISDVYSLQITFLLEPYLHLKKLDQENITVLTKEILTLIKRTEREIKKEREFFYLHLAIVKAFIPVFNIRFAGNEKPFFELYYKTLDKLDEAFKNGLSIEEKEDWFRTTLISIETNKNLHSETFTFLIPRFLNITRSEHELLLLNSILKKRIYRVPYSHAFDKLLIARLQVALREWKLFKTAFPLHYGGGQVELIIAKAELQLCNKKYGTVFKLLESNYEEVRTVYKNYYNDYLNYIISNARKKEKKDIEIKYLREGFIHRLFILPDELERFLELIPKKEHQHVMEELIARIKTNSKGYYFDKISILLLRVGLLDELTRELVKQNNKFALIHDIALRKFPEYTGNFLALYMRHLAETLRQDSVYNYQVKLFNTAKIFLDKLPEKTALELIKKLLDQIGKTGHLYRYINEMYDYPFLKEEENY